VIRTARLALLVAVAACGDRPDRPVPPAQAAASADDTSAPPRLRGTLLVRGDSDMVFVACGTVTERPLVALPASQLPAAVVAVNGTLRDSLWVEFAADTAHGVLTAVEAMFAAPLREGSRCDQPVAPFDIIATGNEPFWRVTFDGSQLVLERPEPPRELVFDADTAAARGALTTIIGRRALGKVHELKLGLLREICRDGMSDAWYPYRAEVRVGNLALHGCARR